MSQTSQSKTLYYVILGLTAILAALTYVEGQPQITVAVIITGVSIGIAAAIKQFEQNPPPSVTTTAPTAAPAAPIAPLANPHFQVPASYFFIAGFLIAAVTVAVSLIYSLVIHAPLQLVEYEEVLGGAASMFFFFAGEYEAHH